MTSAAVLGRAGEVEPFAAALALALRRTTRAKAAAVGVLGGELPSVEGAIASGAARRIAVRAQAHGLDACARGRLAWVRLSVEDQRLPLTARRVTLIAAPAVLAVTTARTAAIDETLAERDLVVLVTGDPEGPLATLASAGLDDALLIHAPRLPRGPATTLARAGLHPPRPVRRLLTDLLEGHA